MQWPEAPDPRRLRLFGAGLAGGAGAAGALFFLGLAGDPHPAAGAAIWIAGSAAGLISMTGGRAARLVYWTVRAITFPPAWLLGQLAMALAFYLVLTPFGVAGRLAGRDPLGLRRDERGASRWEAVPPDPPDGHERMF